MESSLKAAKQIFPHRCPDCGREYFTRGWYDILLCEDYVVIRSCNKKLPLVIKGSEHIIELKGGKHSVVYPSDGEIIIDDGSRRNKRIYHIKFYQGTLYSRYGVQIP